MSRNPSQTMIQNQIDDCIEDCLKCHTVCSATAARVIQKGGKHTPEHIFSMVDCAEICLTAAHFMMRGSPFYGEICKTCADLCTHCAGLCEQAGETDAANACRACAASCRSISQLAQ